MTIATFPLRSVRSSSVIRLCCGGMEEGVCGRVSTCQYKCVDNNRVNNRVSVIYIISIIKVETSLQRAST